MDDTNYSLTSHTIVSTDEAISVLGLQLPINVFFRLLHGNVHVSIETSEYSCLVQQEINDLIDRVHEKNG